MEQLKLCTSDYKFMCVVWDNEPVPSGELVRRCMETLGWKKSTTYTMIKKLSNKGYLKNENSVVRSIVSKKDVQSFESEYTVNNIFEGSLPAFIAAFMSNKKLSRDEAEKLKSLLDSSLEG